ncbi:MAG: hypothetical protein KF700_10705, partial [Hyphomonadaceae bacterium]|nr:hypothetical protein [Hyphomonadaceae bacterium]
QTHHVRSASPALFGLGTEEPPVQTMRASYRRCRQVGFDGANPRFARTHNPLLTAEQSRRF